jgi:uncharacterized short protein YbdD (DUF466 family)
MSENTKIWDQLGQTDPKHTKQFTRAGGFKGTAIKPMWSYRRMTETFGPCGIGWGQGEPTFQVVPGIDGEVLVYCTASIWYCEGETMSRTVYGVGGDKIVTHIKANEKYKTQERWANDDEAFKKAYTDAVTNALKMIGVGADVHMGMFDDNKYVNTMREEFADAPPIEQVRAKEPPRKANGKPATGYREDGTRTSHSLHQDKDWPEFQREVLEARSVTELTKVAFAWSALADKKDWNHEYRTNAKEYINDRKEWLLQQHAPDDDIFPGDRPSTILAGG